MSQYYSRKLELQQIFLGNVDRSVKLFKPQDQDFKPFHEEKLSRYVRPASISVRQLPSTRLLKDSGLPPLLIVVMVCPCGGRSVCDPVTSGRIVQSTSLPPAQRRSISSPPRAHNPFTDPSGQAFGSAGSRSIVPS